MTLYLGDAQLDTIFSFVAKRYGRQEEVPIYRDNQEGIAKLLGVLERARMDEYYPTLLDKATHLIIAINKGHFFSNGNKRLALVIMTFFLAINDKDLKKSSKDSYRELLSILFPEHTECIDFPDFAATDFATYNLSIIIADSGTYNLEYGILKERVLEFLTKSVN
jgi:death-on-curing family protein